MIIKSLSSSIIALAISFSLALPQANIWQTLSKITYKKQFDELLGYKIDVPVFSKEVVALEGKEITIRGYIIPTNGYVSPKEFVLSAYPFSQCFFCGGAGPETVMEITCTEAIKYTPNPVTLKGVLQLNGGDANRLIYALNKAKKTGD